MTWSSIGGRVFIDLVTYIHTHNIFIYLAVNSRLLCYMY